MNVQKSKWSKKHARMFTLFSWLFTMIGFAMLFVPVISAFAYSPTLFGLIFSGIGWYGYKQTQSIGTFPKLATLFSILVLAYSAYAYYQQREIAQALVGIKKQKDAIVKQVVVGAAKKALEERNEAKAREARKQIKANLHSIPNWAPQSPSTIYDYFHTLTPSFFDYSICGQLDSEKARNVEIKVKDIKNGYLSFNQKCDGFRNELVLFKQRSTQRSILGLTIFRGFGQQALEIMYYDSGNWISVKDKYFPNEQDIQKEVRKSLGTLEPHEVQEYQSALADTNSNLSVFYYLPRYGYDVLVKPNFELTNDTTTLARIRWDGERFILVETGNR